jgi:signal transduction histidine kinase
VSVKLYEQDRALVFRVRDWGPGLPPKVAARMFQREFTTKRGHAGIGLSLVADVVRRCGGSVDVDEQPGGGLAVAAAFPLAPRTGA